MPSEFRSSLPSGVGSSRSASRSSAETSRGGGLAFETGLEIPLEADSKIVVGKLGNLPPSARIEGRVVYRDKSGDTGRHIVGVEFLNFINTSREELIDRIHSWEAEPDPLRKLKGG